MPGRNVFVAHVFAEDDGTQYVGVFSTAKKAMAAFARFNNGVTPEFTEYTIQRGPNVGIRFWEFKSGSIEYYSVKEQRVQ